MKRSLQLLFYLALAAVLAGLISCKHAQTGAPASTAGLNVAGKQPAQKIASGLANSAWPKYQGDVRNTGQSRFVGPHTANIKWISTVGPGSSIPTSPVIGPNGTIYAGFSGRSKDTHESIFALDPSDGSVKWRRDLARDHIKSTPAVGSDGTVYMGSQDTNVYALSPADGSVKWASRTGHWASTPTIGADGTVFVGSWDESLYALDPRDGTVKWKQATDIGIASCPAISPDGTIYVGGIGFGVLAVNSTDGSVKWRYPAGGFSESDLKSGRQLTVVSSPAVGSNGTIYVGATEGKLRDGRILSLTPNGTVKWSAKFDGTPYRCPAISAKGTVYAVISRGDSCAVYALRASDGNVKWKFPTGSSAGSSVTIGADGIVYFGCTDKRVYALKPSDGTVLWKYTTGDGVVGSPAIGTDGTVYIGSGDGKVYAFGPKPKH